jgi:hypothetical protein
MMASAAVKLAASALYRRSTPGNSAQYLLFPAKFH